MEIPPWLVPPNYSAIMESAARLSLGQRSQAAKELEDAGRLGVQQQAQNNSASEAGDRLREAYAQLASNERIASEAQKAKQETADAALALRQQQADQLDSYRTGRLGQADTRQSSLDDWRQGLAERATNRQDSLDQWREDVGDRADATLQEHTRHDKAAEKISASRAAALIKGGQATPVTFPEFPGQTFIRQPSGAILKVEPMLHSPTVTLDPEGVPKTYTGRLNDPTMRGIMGTNAPASLQPSQPINFNLPPATGGFDFSQPQSAGDSLTLPSTGQTASVAPTDSGPAPAAAGGFVEVTNPKGKRVRIRSEQLDDALQQGYTQ